MLSPLLGLACQFLQLSLNGDCFSPMGHSFSVVFQCQPFLETLTSKQITHTIAVYNMRKRVNSSLVYNSIDCGQGPTYPLRATHTVHGEEINIEKGLLAIMQVGFRFCRDVLKARNFSLALPSCCLAKQVHFPDSQSFVKFTISLMDLT